MKFNTLAICAAAFGLATPVFADENATTSQPAEQTATTPGDGSAPDEAAPTTTEATPAAVEAAPPAAEAAPDVIPGVITAPPSGKGQIVFYRPSRFVGAALRFTVRENEVDLGRLPDATYFVHVADPGIHEYEVGRNDTLRMEVEDGETYFVQQNISMGLIAGRAVLAPADRAAFEEALPRMERGETATEAAQ